MNFKSVCENKSEKEEKSEQKISVKRRVKRVRKMIIVTVLKRSDL